MRAGRECAHERGVKKVTVGHGVLDQTALHGVARERLQNFVQRRVKLVCGFRAVEPQKLQKTVLYIHGILRLDQFAVDAVAHEGVQISSNHLHSSSSTLPSLRMDSTWQQF